MSNEPSSTTFSGRFPTMAWRLITMAQDDQCADRVQVRNEVLGRYWKPVFYFLRVRRFPLPDAEELTQQFFMRFLEGDWIQRADPQRGRFRTYLLTLLVRFLSDQGPQRASRQTTFERGLVSIDSLLGDEERSYEPAVVETPETVFMRKWARGVMDHVWQRLRQRYEHEDRLEWYEMFVASRLAETSGERVSQQALAERLGMTRDQLRDRLKLVQKRFDLFLREEVADQVGSEADIDDEIRELMSLL